jgi:hypothetical protein
MPAGAADGPCYLRFRTTVKDRGVIAPGGIRTRTRTGGSAPRGPPREKLEKVVHGRRREL